MSEPRLYIVMGVSSSGKSSVGAALAERLGAPFLDSDAFHPKANIEKMSAGIPLTDEDRWPWLKALGEGLRKAGDDHGQAVAACSALRRVYREYLGEAARMPIRFVHLSGSRELIAERMGKRTGHFMPLSLLDSQLATLEPPEPDEFAFSVPIEGSIEQITDEILERLRKLEINL